MTVNELIAYLERYKELFNGNDRVIATDDVHDEGWFPVIDVHATALIGETINEAERVFNIQFHVMSWIETHDLVEEERKMRYGKTNV